jgi:hypothetical protein
MIYGISFKSIVIGLVIFGIISIIGYQSYKINTLESKNEILNVQITNAIEVNNELNSSLAYIDKDYTKKLKTLNSSLSKKEQDLKDIEQMKRRIKDENGSINTARSILSRMREQTLSTNKSRD